MTREEAITILSYYDMGFYDINGFPVPAHKLAEACDMAIEALSAEAVQGEWGDKEVFCETDDDHIIDEWQSARCSNCGKYHTTPYLYCFTKYDYCPNCGAYMGGETDG